VAYPGIFFGGVQQIQLRIEGTENGNLGAVAPTQGFHSICKWMKPIFWLGCYGCIFHGTGNSAQLFQNFEISGVGGCSTNSVEDRGQRERGSGGGSPLFRGFQKICKLMKPVFCFKLLRMYNSRNWKFGSALAKLRNFGGLGGWTPQTLPSVCHCLQCPREQRVTKGYTCVLCASTFISAKG
jgi:hypothetical protein